MKFKSTLIFALALSFCSCQLFAAKMMNYNKQKLQHNSEGEHIRVLLESDIPSALLEVKGNYKVMATGSETPLSHGSIGKRFVVHGMKEGLRWGEEYPDVYQISVIPEGKGTTCFVNGIQYQGTITITQGANYAMTIVNELPIEDFLRSIFAVKLDLSCSKEALAALAITERTRAYYLATKQLRSQRLWDVEASECKYFGCAMDTTSRGIFDAICETRFMIMQQNKKDALFLAKWCQMQEDNALSLNGAEEMALQGYDAKKILKTYFPHSEIITTCEPAPVFIR